MIHLRAHPVGVHAKGTTKTVPHLKFDLAKLEKLNDPRRFDDLIPDVMWGALDVSAPRVVVEIGAGTGLFAARFASMTPEATFYAVDMEPAMIEWMRANRPEVAAGWMVPVLSEESSVPLDDGIADAVVMVNLHHELATPQATYAEAARLLHAGGRIMVADWAPRETPKGPPLAVRATEQEIADVMAGAGFADVASHEGLPHHSLLTGTKP